MIIDLNMLFTQLKIKYPQLSVEQYLDLTTVSISGIRLLPRCSLEISPDFLYLCESQHPLSPDSLPEHLLLLCVCRPGQLPVPYPGVIWMETDLEWAVIFNTLQEIYIMFQNWDRSMHDSLIQNLGLNHLIQISEPLLKNPVLIYDLSLKILAHSTAYVAADKIFPYAIQQGHLTSDMVQQFRNEKIFDTLTETGIYISADKRSERYNEIIKLIYINEKPMGYCVLVLVNPSNMKYMRRMFENFFESVQIGLEKMMQSIKTEGFMYEYLLIDLLENDSPEISIVKDRLTYIDLPFASDFYLCVLNLTSPGSITIPFLLHQIQQSIPESRVFEYQGQILILIFEQKRLDPFHYMEQFPLIYHTLLHEIHQHNMSGGVSRPFHQITELKAAYREARAALVFLEKEHSYPTDLIFFEQIALQFLCRSDTAGSGYGITKHEKLNRILADDTKNHTCCAQILDTYLKTNCQATETAKLLHMHRNNVIYHIRKMEARYYLQLDDSEERLKLSLAFYAQKTCTDIES